MNARALAAEYEGLGFDTLPLTYDTKDPLPGLVGWQQRASAVLWAAAPDDSNVALRGGGDIHAVFIDADDKNRPGTADNVRRLLNGWGIYTDGDVPIVRTASLIGNHFYLRTTVHLAGDSRRLCPELGAGELRYGSGAYVVAPGSVVDGHPYELVAGDLRQLPALDFQDLRYLANVELATGTAASKATPRLPRKAWALLRGQNTERYPSRSEAEQAILASLVGAGFDFENVLLLFTTNPAAGKFGEMWRKSERNALRWLRLSYSNAVKWSEASESAGRKRGREAQRWALSVPWPGRVGSTDRAVYLAHCEIARRSGVLSYAAPVRTLAELAGVAYLTAQRSNLRLVEHGLVRHDRTHVGTLAATYQLEPVHSYITSTQTEGVEVIQLCTLDNDAFRRAGLGKAAGELLAHLRLHPGLTAAELAESTGRHISTVRRALGRMARLVDPLTGEVLRLVESDGDTWRAVDDVDLTAVARAVGTSGAGARQKLKHQKERRDFRQAMVRAEAATTQE